VPQLAQSSPPPEEWAPWVDFGVPHGRALAESAAPITLTATRHSATSAFFEFALLIRHIPSELVSAVVRRPCEAKAPVEPSAECESHEDRNPLQQFAIF